MKVNKSTSRTFCRKASMDPTKTATYFSFTNTLNNTYLILELRAITPSSSTVGNILLKIRDLYIQ